ncbi:putative bulb-type lectin domain-containing protein [Helianthus anomalus]
MVFLESNCGLSGLSCRCTNYSVPSSGLVSKRDYPVSDGAILNLTASAELVLQDVDGSTVWTTNAIGKSVAGLNLMMMET